MNWEFLTGDSLGELAKKYPEAYAFILHRALMDEVSSRRFELFSLNSFNLRNNKSFDEQRKWLAQRIEALEREINDNASQSQA